MIQLAGVSKGYFEQRVLDNIHLELKRGDFLYIVGGSGAGKTSFLRLIATDEVPSSGTISLFGYQLNRVSSSTLRAIRRAVGYIPQNLQLIPDFSVMDNISILSREAKAKTTEVMERLGLITKKDKLAKHLSGGEAQRVAIARALVRAPELIIADEPTGAQDKEYTWTLMDLFLKANLGGATIVLATHDREIVRRVRKRCAVLKNGQLIFEESLCTY